jgi:hypothetical protein
MSTFNRKRQIMEQEPSTQDEIIEMALEEWRSGDQIKQAGLDRNYTNLFKAFAKLIATEEREACAKVCEALRETIWEYHEEHLKAAACNVCTNLAIAMRARGEA